MKKIAAILICTVILSAVSARRNISFAVPENDDSAAAAVVYCADNKEVLYSHNSNDRLPIASITKIMTCLLALEYAAHEDVLVTVTPEMYAEGSSMYLREGEKLRLSSLARGMMACSGNDAANAIALTVAGSIQGFAGLMNDKARSLGMNDTNFVTPSGLDCDGHYSTAYDMALLGAAAMENEDFVQAVSCSSAEVSFEYPVGKTVLFQNHNRLLREYDGCIGIKTGYTDKAGRTLVSCAERDGVRLVAVTLNDPDDWNDHKRLLDRGFASVIRVCLTDNCPSLTLPVAGTGESITLTAEKKLYAVVRNDQAEGITWLLYAPRFLYPGETDCKLCRIEYRLDGRVIAECCLSKYLPR